MDRHERSSSRLSSNTEDFSSTSCMTILTRAYAMGDRSSSLSLRHYQSHLIHGKCPRARGTESIYYIARSSTRVILCTIRFAIMIRQRPLNSACCFPFKLCISLHQMIPSSYQSKRSVHENIKYRSDMLASVPHVLCSRIVAPVKENQSAIAVV